VVSAADGEGGDVKEGMKDWEENEGRATGAAANGGAIAIDC